MPAVRVCLAHRVHMTGPHRANRRRGCVVSHTERATMVGGFGLAAVPNEPRDDERELVIRVQHGDREAFAELARRHARRAFAIAYRILRHTQDAEDLVQDSLLAALDGIGALDPAT